MHYNPKLPEELLVLSERLKLLIVKLDNVFEIKHYLHWFNQPTQQKIVSYYHYHNQLTAFTSQLLQQYYLAAITNLNKNDLVLKYTSQYKPYIFAPKNIGQDLKFNISHSNDYVVLATYSGNDYDIGVDIEKIDNQIDLTELAKVVFSPFEQKLINHQPTRFFKLWTKKEALIKALGIGFMDDFYQTTQLNLDDIEINDKYVIISQQFNDYYLSVCFYKILDFHN